MAARSSLIFFRRSLISSAHNRQLFSSFSGKDIVERVESDIESAQPAPYGLFDPFVFVWCTPPLLPIPDGFPYTGRARLCSVELVRQDKDEYIQNSVYPPPWVAKNVKPFRMCTVIVRGFWKIELELLVGTAALPVRIRKAKIMKGLDHRMPGLEEFLNTKGINAKTANTFFNLYREKQEIVKPA